MAQAWDSLRAHYESSGRMEEFELFRSHLSVDGDPAASYEAMAKRLGLTEGDIRNRLHAARTRIAAAIRAVVRSYTDTEEDAKEEIRDLLSAFS